MISFESDIDNIEGGEMEISERNMEKSGSMRMRRQMKKAESFRRADGTLGEKQPAWDKIRNKEEIRRKLLRSVSTNIYTLKFVSCGVQQRLCTSLSKPSDIYKNSLLINVWNKIG